VAIPDELDLQFGPNILDSIVFIIDYTIYYNILINIYLNNNFIII
jgi:hypothetical protein